MIISFDYTEKQLFYFIFYEPYYYISIIIVIKYIFRMLFKLHEDNKTITLYVIDQLKIK